MTGTLRKTNSNQNGSVLVLALLFLLVLTMLGIAATTNTLVQERMAGGERDINVAFQAGESALRGGEVWLASQPLVPIAKDGGVCGDTSNSGNDCADTHEVWTTGSMPPLIADYSGGTPYLDWANDARTYGNQLHNYDVYDDDDDFEADLNQPRYVIEFHSQEVDSLTVGLAPATGRRLYTVSGRGQGAAPQTTTESVVQSVYARQF